MGSTPLNSFFLIIFSLNVFFENAVGVPYDYSYKLECLPNPEAPLYNGGIAVNPEFNEELKGWTAAGNAKIAIAKSADGNNYVVASNITELSDGISQTINAENGKMYTVSAWVQIAGLVEARVQGAIKTSTGGNITLNWVFAKSGCWKMFKGGFTANVTEPVELQFQVFDATGLEIWVDSISVQPFTQEEWTSHNDQNVEKVRKIKVKFEAVDQNGKHVANAVVSIRQLQPNFPFGGLLNELIINNPPNQKWFLERFNYAVFENELKWSYTEKVQGVENYTITDAMLEFTKANGLITRGHNILWDHIKYMEPWMQALSPDELREAAVKRIKSVVGRYKGQFTHWDALNENMHYDGISKVFPGKSTDIFKLAHEIDPETMLFLNEFNVIESNPAVAKAGTPVFLAKIDELRSGGYDGPLGIGLQCHFDDAGFVPNIPSIRANLDMFAATGLPIWATEFTVGILAANQIRDVVVLLREIYSYPAVDGIVLWNALDSKGKCWSMCVTEPISYKNLPVGDAIDGFMRQYIRVADSNGTTDSNGIFEASLVHGEYEANVTLPNGPHSTEPEKFNLLPNGNLTTVQLKVNV